MKASFHGGKKCKHKQTRKQIRGRSPRTSGSRDPQLSIKSQCVSPLPASPRSVRLHTPCQILSSSHSTCTLQSAHTLPDSVLPPFHLHTAISTHPARFCPPPIPPAHCNLHTPCQILSSAHSTCTLQSAHTLPDSVLPPFLLHTAIYHFYNCRHRMS